MKKLLVLCLSLLMLTAFGCKSTSSGDAPASSADAKADTASSADAKADTASSADAKADSAKGAPACATYKLNPDALTPEDVAAVVVSFYQELDPIAVKAGSDCDVFVRDLIAHFDSCHDNLFVVLRYEASLDKDSPEAQKIQAMVEGIDQNTHAYNSMMELCSDNPGTGYFALRVVQVCLEAAGVGEEDDNEEMLNDEGVD